MGAIPNNLKEIWTGRKHEESSLSLKLDCTFVIRLVFPAAMPPTIQLLGIPGGQRVHQAQEGPKGHSRMAVFLGQSHLFQRQ